MDPGASLALIALLIAGSAFFGVAEIAVAAARRPRLRQLLDEGEARAAKVLAVQDAPGSYFTVGQIGQNAIAVLGGVVGEGALSPGLAAALEPWLGRAAAESAGFWISFGGITASFVLLADLFPKRLALSRPEDVALRVVGPMLALAALMGPLVWAFDRAADAIFRGLGLPPQRDEQVTHADILAMAAAGAAAGTVDRQEQQVIENVFELDTRTVESVMTPRERIVHIERDDPPELIRARIEDRPHSTYLVCDGGVDRPVGTVDAKDLLLRELADQPMALQDEPSLLRPLLVVPAGLTLMEVLGQFRAAHEDFAVILNEYRLVVGIITLNDVMSTVMGGLVAPPAEDQVCRREDGSWLIDGLTPIPDVLRALDLEELPKSGQYDTLAGFLMAMLRRIPRRTDRIEAAGHRFEVLDVDDYKIDQVLVTRLPVDVAG